MAVLAHLDSESESDSEEAETTEGDRDAGPFSASASASEHGGADGEGGKEKESVEEAEGGKKEADKESEVRGSMIATPTHTQSPCLSPLGTLMCMACWFFSPLPHTSPLHPPLAATATSPSLHPHQTLYHAKEEEEDGVKISATGRSSMEEGRPSGGKGRPSRSVEKGRFSLSDEKGRFSLDKDGNRKSGGNDLSIKMAEGAEAGGNR